jgi:hypothetical protein
MRLSRFLFISLLVLLAAPIRSGAQVDPAPGIRTTALFTVTSPDTVIMLEHKFLIAGSDTIRVDGLYHLERDRHYSIDYRYGRLRVRSIPDDSADTVRQKAELHVSYRYLPLTFSDTYRLYEFDEDTTEAGPEERIMIPSRAFTLDDIFTSQLRTSGSLIRGLNVGTNRDLTLQSGFRMQLSGNLSEKYEIAATLTDENTPIQPEGTTQTLRELDKVYIQIFSDDAEATFGDFDLQVSETEFSRINRRLQGAMGSYRYRAGYGDGEVMFTGAGMRGKFHTNEFRGLEGVQGPYRLTGRNNERAIIIVPGSERVYIDGEQMTRGETNDYVIEYGNGDVVFTAQRLITAASRIVIDFEYTDRQYNRNFLGARTKQTVLDDRLQFSFGYFRESDDRNSPIDFILGDEEKQLLAESGNDRNRASRSSVRDVGVDEETGRGLGQYILRDTTIAGEAVEYYVFDPGAPEARYSIGFTFVGDGEGEYRRIAAGQFEYTGPGSGSYLPVQYLPMPQLHQLGNATIDLTVTEGIRLFGEYSFSSFDANRFSAIDNEFNDGSASLFGIHFAPEQLTLFNRNAGKLDVRLLQRTVEERYRSMDRVNEIEFNRRWDLRDDLRGDEVIREASMSYSPTDRVSVGSSFGTISRGDLFDSHRYDASLSIAGASAPTIRYYIESIQSEDFLSMQKGDWFRQRGDLFYRWRVTERTGITPGVSFEHENRRLETLQSANLQPGSFNFTRIAPRLELDEFARMRLFTELEFREDAEYLDGRAAPESNSITSRSTWQLRDWNTFSSRVDFTYRQKKYSDAFREAGRGDDETILIRNQTRYAPLQRFLETDFFYEVTTQRSARLERVFVRVPKGTGNYRYLGDLNNDGLANENEFELVRFDGDYIVVTVPTDDLFPVVDLKSSLRLRMNPARILGSADGIAARAVRAVSAETYIRLEEKSRDPRTSNLYLLRLSTFRDDEQTIVGNQLFTQDVYINEQSREFSLRFRYSEREGMNQFSLGVERSSFIERSVRLRWQLVEEIAHQLDVINRRDNVNATQPSNRERSITSNTLLSDLSYRPSPRVEVGFVLEATTAEDTFPEFPVDASINAQSIRLRYAIQTRGQLHAEFSREQVLLTRSVPDALPVYVLPFELTGGRVEGLGWLWRAGFDYRVSRFVQASIQYDGRAEHDRPVIHQGRGEIRVFF